MSKTTTAFYLALNMEADGAVPEWIQLLPEGPLVQGVDGRFWFVNDAAEIIHEFEQAGRPLPIDFDHAIERRAPRGEKAPAVGWIEKIEHRKGQGIWGKVAWNELGASALKNREYRYISPVFRYEWETREVLELINAGLTNRPNLKMEALNQEEDVALPKAVLGALGLADGADETAVLAAITALSNKAPKKDHSVNHEDFVPKAQFDELAKTAANNQKQLDSYAAKEREAAVNAGIEEGKIAPASKNHYLAICENMGLEKFAEFMKSQPKIIQDTKLDQKKPQAGNSANALDADQLAVCSALGLDEAEYRKNVEVAS